jgi:dihydrofolate reductase
VAVSRRPVVAYTATSLDGFIAGPDDDLSWLGGAGDEAEFGYEAFFTRVGALIMGRRTYEQVLSFGAWPYEGRPAYVLSSSLPPQESGAVTVTNATPAQLIDHLSEGEGLIWLVGGGRLFTSFADAGLIDEWILTVAPVLLAGGVPLLTPGAARSGLDLVEERRLSRGFVQLHYRTAR